MMSVIAAAWAAAACLHAAEAAQWPLAQYNATLVFSSKPQAMGQYLSNDWWVVGPVTLVQTLPAAAGGRHGFEVSPKSIDGQPYDSRSAQYNASLLPALPLTLKPGDSLVKMVSNDGWKGSNPTYITSAMVLTVVGAPPPPRSYRPAYFRGGGPSIATTHWSASQLRWDLYPSLPLPPPDKALCPPGHPELCAAPASLDETVRKPYSMPQIDHVHGYSGAQVHPTANMPGAHYGEAIPQASGLAAVRLMLNDADSSEKAAAAHGLVQYLLRSTKLISLLRSVFC